MQADRECERRMAELAQRAAKTGIAQRTWFLTPAQREQAEICARQAGVSLFAWGGVEDAERQVVTFADEDWIPDWPVMCLNITWRAQYGALEHRDLLGAILSLGMDREKLGDIFVKEGAATVFALADMARYLEANLDRAGNVPVQVRLLEEAPSVAQQEGTQMRSTVASTRLDALLGVAFRLSRGRAAELVSAGRVQVDFRPELRPDLKIAEGTTISVRGLGRAKVAEIGGRTKKDRISVTMLRF